MMLYLTGGSVSLSRSPSNPQNDSGVSLGGFISSTTVPNGSLNSLFDLISSYTLEKRQKETIAVGLINKFNKTVNNIELKIITDEYDVASFKVAAVPLDKDLLMESISNRYEEPMNAEFHNVSFNRTSVEIEILNPGIIGEELILYPFNVVINITEEEMDGTWNAFEEAFSDDENYSIKRITKNKFKIESRDERVLEIPLDCSYLSSDSLSANFLGQFKNRLDNSVLIKEELRSGEGIGIWIQREIKKNKYTSNEEMIINFNEGFVLNNTEEIELIISYELSTEDNYSKPEYKEEYS